MVKTDLLNLAFPVFCHGKMSQTRIALVVDERTCTYGEMSRAAGRVGAWLRSGAGHERPLRVGILASRSYETYAGILGTAWAGGAFVPLGLKQPAERLGVIFDKIDLDALIVDRRGAMRLAEFGNKLPPRVLSPSPASGPSHVTLWDELDALPEPTPPRAVCPDDPAYIIFTSGTTGVPKGVAVSDRNIAHYLQAVRAMYHLGPKDRVSQFFEPTFDVSVHEMFSAFDAGASLHVLPETKVMSPAGFIREHQITLWQSVPSVIAMMQRMKHLAPGSLPSIRYTQFGGEGVPVASIAAWKAAAPNTSIDNQYGPTEATVACLYQRINGQPIETPGRGTFSIGKPYPGMEAAIVGPDNAFLPDGEQGELAVSGSQLALGYYGDDEQTARRFPTLNHPKLGPSRWYLTGDLAYRDENGFFHCLGRIDNQVKINGFRVELEEVEAHLRAVCHSDSVAAVAWPMSNGNAAGIIAFVSGADVDPPAVREQLRGRMPIYMLPTRVMTLDAIPLSVNGKVDRKVLCGMLEQGK